MVKNTHGGKKAKKAKNSAPIRFKQPLLIADQDQSYGQVEKVLGDMRCSVLCKDGVERICRIRGKFKRRVWISNGDVVLVALRDFEDEKGDIIHKYMPDDIQSLEDIEEYSVNKVKKIDSTHVLSIDDLIGGTDPDPVDENDEICFEAI